jgi:hypothetical protein
MMRFMCPFCRADFTGFTAQLCSGSFLDCDHHPSGVRPIFVEADDNGHLGPDEEERLAQARETYGRMGR